MIALTTNPQSASAMEKELLNEFHTFDKLLKAWMAIQVQPGKVTLKDQTSTTERTHAHAYARTKINNITTEYNTKHTVFT